jgi:hypothetical protein
MQVRATPPQDYPPQDYPLQNYLDTSDPGDN